MYSSETSQSFPSKINTLNCAAAWWKLPCTTCIGRSGYPFHIVFGLPAAAPPPRQASRLAGPSEPCGARGNGSPYFSRSVIPISTRGADYAHHITVCPSEFSDLPKALPRRYVMSSHLNCMSPAATTKLYLPFNRLQVFAFCESDFYNL